MRITQPNGVLLALTVLSLAAACSSDPVDPPPPPPDECAATLPAAAVTCAEAGCNTTTGTKTAGIANLSADAGRQWMVVAWATSEIFDEGDINVGYERSTVGGLTAEEARQRGLHRNVDLRAHFSEQEHDLLLGTARQNRLAAEHLIRQNDVEGPLDLTGVTGTAIRGRTAELLPPGVIRQGNACSAAAPTCGATALCVIPSGTTDGTCESALMLKWRPNPGQPAQFVEVAATVRGVGTHAAIVTDDVDSVPEADVAELLKRFDEHIAPLDHTFFGEPVNAQGADRDGNGVVILFFTSKVADISADLAGFFQSLDLRDPTTVAGSNGADLLFMQPPGSNVSLHQVSGTMAHEYQHLINYYAKVVNRQSQQEVVWMDEGLATFAEDFTGYGSDAFKNIAAYLPCVNEVSLTGGHICDGPADPDSVFRRGMAHLLVRYLFEQKGGATWGSSAGQVTDAGGIAAVRALVQSAETGQELWTQPKTGKSFHQWLGDLLTVVAVDGAPYPDVSCNPTVSLVAPATDAYTGYQRGIDLRTSFADAGGSTIPLNGPGTVTLENEEVPMLVNGGELRTVMVTGTSRVAITGPAEDYTLGMRPLPIGQ